MLVQHSDHGAILPGPILWCFMYQFEQLQILVSMKFLDQFPMNIKG